MDIRSYMYLVKLLTRKETVLRRALDDAIKARLKGNISKQKSFQERIEKTLSKYHGKFEDFDTFA